MFLTSTHPTILKRLAPSGAIPFITAGWRGSETLFKLRDQLAANWAEAGIERPMPVAVQQYIHVTDKRDEALMAAERTRFIGRTLAPLRDLAIPLDGATIRAEPFEGEPPLEFFADSVLIGDPHHVAERMVAEIRRINPVHYSCFFQFGDMPIARARRALERFGSEVLPLVEKELGPIAGIGRPGVRAAAE